MYLILFGSASVSAIFQRVFNSVSSPFQLLFATVLIDFRPHFDQFAEFEQPIELARERPPVIVAREFQVMTLNWAVIDVDHRAGGDIETPFGVTQRDRAGDPIGCCKNDMSHNSITFSLRASSFGYHLDRQ